MEFDTIKIPRICAESLTTQELADKLDEMLTNHPANLKVAETAWAIIYYEAIKNAIQKGNRFDSIIDKSKKVNSGNNLSWCYDVRKYLDQFSVKTPKIKLPRLQKIYYGAPGGGKSHKAKETTKSYKVFRTTFHPDTDYSSFVGTYTPTINDKCIVRDFTGKIVPNEFNKKIEYSFVPQIFTKAYLKAWDEYLKTDSDVEPVCILIEELNRGNCAQIFGDLFQLLDRTKDGFSEYSIIAESALTVHIKKVLGSNLEKYYTIIQENSDLTETGTTIPAWDSKKTENNEIRLCFPPNLSIVCTMNTSDQSLFPMDSAFKRRWDWEYVPIDYDNDKSDINIVVDDQHIYGWLDFLYVINGLITKETNSEDKQMGNFFVKGDVNQEVDVDQFVSKVMFYLWSEVCKDNPKARKNIFKVLDESEKDKTKSIDFTFNDLFVKEKKIPYLVKFMNFHGIQNTYSQAESTVKSDSIQKEQSKNRYYSVNNKGKFARQSVAYEAVREYIENNNLQINNPQDVVRVINDWSKIQVSKMTANNPMISNVTNKRSRQITGWNIFVNCRDWFADNFEDFKEKVNNSNLGIKITEI